MISCQVLDETSSISIVRILWFSVFSCNQNFPYFIDLTNQLIEKFVSRSPAPNPPSLLLKKKKNNVTMLSGTWILVNSLEVEFEKISEYCRRLSLNLSEDSRLRLNAVLFFFFFLAALFHIHRVLETLVMTTVCCRLVQVEGGGVECLTQRHPWVVASVQIFLRSCERPSSVASRRPSLNTGALARDSFRRAQRCHTKGCTDNPLWPVGV